MGKIGTKMPNFCLNRIRPLVRVRSPPNQVNVDQEKKDCFVGVEKENSVEKSATISGRRIMIVVDSTIEAKNAVQWSLSHTVQDQDMIILLYVTKPSKKVEQCIEKDMNQRIPGFVASMKSSCQLKRPEVHVEVAVAEGKEKGPVIVEEAKRRETSLLVVGQKKRFVTWRLMLMWAGNRVVPASGVAEYCVQNATCMAIAVRRKSKNLVDILLLLKDRKISGFWLD